MNFIKSKQEVLLSIQLQNNGVVYRKIKQTATYTLGAFEKSLNATNNLVTFDCLYFRRSARNYSAPTGSVVLKFYIEDFCSILLF